MQQSRQPWTLLSAELNVIKAQAVRDREYQLRLVGTKQANPDDLEQAEGKLAEAKMILGDIFPAHPVAMQRPAAPQRV